MSPAWPALSGPAPCQNLAPVPFLSPIRPQDVAHRGGDTEAHQGGDTEARHPLLLSPSASAWPCVLPSPPCPFGVTSRGHSGGWGLSPAQGLWHQGDFGAHSGSSPGPAQGLKEFWQQKHPEHPPGVSRLLTGCQGCHSVTRGVTVSPDSASRAQPGLGAPRLLRLLRR